MLQRNTKLYGPMNALDLESDSSCWNSEGSSTTNKKAAAAAAAACWFLLDFQRPVYPTQIRIQFQAGFCAETCAVYEKRVEESVEDGGGTTTCSTWECIDDDIEWEDVHETQTHDLPSSKQATSALKLVLDDFTDFYGRVTIYRIEIWGKEQS